MRKAFFISPHLDDVAFSCGGTLIALARANWHTHLCTVFTASVRDPQGFALQCQTDKNIAAEIDYMRLRRAEDERFAAQAGANTISHLDFMEAPHRGYESAAELFGDVSATDDVWQMISHALEKTITNYAPEIIFAPQGLGSHVDHRQTIRALRASRYLASVIWYRDTPYAVRDARAQPSSLLPTGMREIRFDITHTLEQKITAIESYVTQLDFQFGGVARMGETLRAFHREEARCEEGAVERFLSADSDFVLV